MIGFDQLIAKSFGRELALSFGGHATTGNGSGIPNGIVTAAGNGGTALKLFGGTASTFLDFGDLVSLYMSVPAPARTVGSWMMANSAIQKVLSFRDDNGNRVVLPGLTGSGSLSLLGRPIHENPDMAAVASASKSVLFGDLKAYTVAEVQPMRVELSKDWKFGTDQVAIKVVRRLDSDLLDVGSVKYLVSAST